MGLRADSMVAVAFSGATLVLVILSPNALRDWLHNYLDPRLKILQRKK